MGGCRDQSARRCNVRTRLTWPGRRDEADGNAGCGGAGPRRAGARDRLADAAVTARDRHRAALGSIDIASRSALAPQPARRVRAAIQVSPVESALGALDVFA